MGRLNSWSVTSSLVVIERMNGRRWLHQIESIKAVSIKLVKVYQIRQSFYIPCFMTTACLSHKEQVCWSALLERKLFCLNCSFIVNCAHSSNKVFFLPNEAVDIKNPHIAHKRISLILYIYSQNMLERELHEPNKNRCIPCIPSCVNNRYMTPTIFSILKHCEYILFDLFR